MKKKPKGELSPGKFKKGHTMDETRPLTEREKRTLAALVNAWPDPDTFTGTEADANLSRKG